MTITKEDIAQAIQINPDRIRDFYQNGNVIRVFLTDTQEVLTVNLDKCQPFIEKNQAATPRPRQEEGAIITSWTITKGILGAIAILSLGIGAIRIIADMTTEQPSEFKRMADEAEAKEIIYEQSLCNNGNKESCAKVDELWKKRKK
ncbi:MAG: hypothetical protein J0L70_23095 [Leptolyngbya sp. UWPOB_LEPTO1]|uniref:hypothetical protein n=1 Tax=Leptolyngbya sp. UWPOB_LEPTO1 TaxID=2815653 RepID=UPI001ACB42E7|nr:hypothetical protein [Leptolyngbya sp. UWPOB_LEPTO1]MBN8563427.1 hypothetical protein [Leptolyngbya sp. UWPOB_LEPTO1]